MSPVRSPSDAAPVRPERDCELLSPAGIGDVERPLPILERLANSGTLRKMLVLLAFVLLWESYARWLANPLLFPTFSDAVTIFVEDLLNGTLSDRVLTSLRSLLFGYGTGLLVAAVLTSIAVSTRIGTDVLTTLTSMFNPLPAIALLPLALIWFGLGTGSIVFVVVHSVLWAVSLSTLSGFRAVPETLRMSGRNYGLSGLRYVMLVLVPAAFPAILTGLKIGWAFAWRTLIAAELVFGVSSRSGGLGWYIFEARSDLDTARVFAGLLAVILIGLGVETLVFRSIEVRTVQRWGMQS